MTPEELFNFLKGLSPDERRKFYTEFHNLVDIKVDEAYSKALSMVGSRDYNQKRYMASEEHNFLQTLWRGSEQLKSAQEHIDRLQAQKK